ncbi:MAG: hypothetical protein ACR2MF_10295 [Chthoniobacterales bacterium]
MTRDKEKGITGPGILKLVTCHWSHYSQCLKALSIAFCLGSAVLVGGCADPLEKPIGQEAQEHFQRGISGQGELGNIDRSDDPYVKPREGGSAHP